MRTVWHREPSSLNHCVTSRAIGYKAVAGNQWAGPFRHSWQDARSDAYAYNHQLNAQVA